MKQIRIGKLNIRLKYKFKFSFCVNDKVKKKQLKNNIETIFLLELFSKIIANDFIPNFLSSFISWNA